MEEVVLSQEDLKEKSAERKGRREQCVQSMDVWKHAGPGACGSRLWLAREVKEQSGGEGGYKWVVPVLPAL